MMTSRSCCCSHARNWKRRRRRRPLPLRAPLQRRRRKPADPRRRCHHLQLLPARIRIERVHFSPAGDLCTLHAGALCTQSAIARSVHMKLATKVNIRELRAHLRAYLDKCEPLVVMRGRYKVAVILPTGLKRWPSAEEERAALARMKKA